MGFKLQINGWRSPLIAASMGFLLWAPPVRAAEQVVLKYGLLSGSLPVSDLREFAETGQPSRDLRAFLRLTRQEPETFRRSLTQPLPIQVRSLDRLLNHPLGEVVLDQVGQIVHTPTNTADREALRAALILSASQNSEINLLQTLENYPTSEVMIQGDRVVQGYRRLNGLMAQARTVTSWFDLAREMIRPILRN